MRTPLTLPELGYSPDSLEPTISKETLGFHYGKHLQAYINNLNKLIVDTEYAEASLEEMASKAQGGIGNNAGQVLNHILYFEQFTPNQPKSAPEGPLAAAITKSFGSFDQMKETMNTAAVSLFGSGWAWLCADAQGQLCIQQMSNADNPLRHNMTPILTFDVWEHAYYLDYQNRRPDYVAALWDLIDWNVIEKRYK